MAIQESGLNRLPITGVRWSGVQYGCTTRNGGVSVGPWSSMNLGMHVNDDLAAVAENRRRLRSMLPSDPLWLEQVHGIDVVDADVWHARHGDIPGAPGVDAGESAYEPLRAGPFGDAAVTTQPGRVLAIMTADCLPVVIGDTEGRGVAVAHAGWRGLAAGVLEHTMAALKARVPNSIGWRAWIGPCIGQANFEVGEEVFDSFVQADAQAAQFFVKGGAIGKWHADLPGLACHRLEKIGVYNVETSGLCTYEHRELLYSYRRESITGRMATLAWLEPMRKSA